MRVWLTGVVVLFVVVQGAQWIQGFLLPLPLYILGGAFLAIASNYDKGILPETRQFSTPQSSKPKPQHSPSQPLPAPTQPVVSLESMPQQTQSEINS